MTSRGEVVMVTGGSGFIGQHIIKMLLQERINLGIREIRSVDIKPYKNKIGHQESSDLATYIGDICQPKMLDHIFSDVGTVFHCASLVSVEYPPKFMELEHVNIDGTRNIIDLCIKHNVRHLIYTSCASVCVVPFKGHSTFSLVINQTESKALTPIYDSKISPMAFDKEFLIPGYSSSKLRAERIVLSSCGATLNSQNGYLVTTALRPPLTYGEGDKHFMPNVLKYLADHGNQYPRIAGAGGKQQLVYAGNVAWGHICAYKTLKSSPRSIAGLPVFITDDTPINDLSRFVQKIAAASQSLKISTTYWYLPHFVFFLLALVIEFVIKALHPLTQTKLKYSMRAISSFTASVLMFNRLRASIHMDYEPIFNEKKALQLSANWYAKWWTENIHK